MRPGGGRHGGTVGAGAWRPGNRPSGPRVPGYRRSGRLPEVRGRRRRGRCVPDWRGRGWRRGRRSERTGGCWDRSRPASAVSGSLIPTNSVPPRIVPDWIGPRPADVDVLGVRGVEHGARVPDELAAGAVVGEQGELGDACCSLFLTSGDLGDRPLGHAGQASPGSWSGGCRSAGCSRRCRRRRPAPRRSTGPARAWPGAGRLAGASPGGGWRRPSPGRRRVTLVVSR